MNMCMENERRHEEPKVGTVGTVGTPTGTSIWADKTPAGYFARGGYRKSSWTLYVCMYVRIQS